MGLLKKVLNLKQIQRTKRKLAIITGMHMKLKRLSSSASEDYRTVQILKSFGFNKVLDVGANTGQFAESLIEFGFKGKIISFEPTSHAYNKLIKRTLKHKNWYLAEKCAIGDIDGFLDINISKNSLFNSVKTISKEYASYNPDSMIVGKENVPIYKLDSLQDKLIDENDIIFLKIDTQGFEKEVLSGASELLKNIKGIKIEIPLQPIYEKVSWDVIDIMKFFKDKGFDCISVSEVAVNNQTGVVHEIDGIFVAQSILKKTSSDIEPRKL